MIPGLNSSVPTGQVGYAVDQLPNDAMNRHLGEVTLAEAGIANAGGAGGDKLPCLLQEAVGARVLVSGQDLIGGQEKALRRKDNIKAAGVKVGQDLSQRRQCCGGAFTGQQHRGQSPLRYQPGGAVLDLGDRNDLVVSVFGGGELTLRLMEFP